MAQKVERVEILDIGTKTLKDLRAELKELKTQLEGLVIGSDDYNNTLQEISNKQRELASVTKSSVSDMEGSYNALNKELNELRKAWKATNDEAERSSLGERMSELNTQLKDLDASVGNYQRNVGNYGSALDDLDLKAQNISQSYDNAIASSNKWVESGEQLEKTMMAMVSTMAIAQTAMNLMGIEGEEAEKIMEKLQAVLAITSGFKAVAEGVKGFNQLSKSINLSSLAMNGFKKAMIASGIGAAVVLVGTLAANWDKVSKALGIAKKEQEKFNSEYFRMSDSDFDLSQRIAEAGGQMEKESILNRQRYYRRMLEEAQVHRDNIKNMTSQEYKDALDKENEYYELLKKANDDYTVWEVKNRKEVEDKKKEDFKTFKEDYKTTQNELQSLLASGNFFKETALQYKKDKENWDKLLKEKKISQEQYNEAIAKIDIDYAKKVQDEQIRLAEEAANATLAEADDRIQNIYNRYQKESEIAVREFNSKMVDLSIAGDESAMRKLNEDFIQSQIVALEELKTKLAEYGDAAKDIIFDIEGEISNLTNDKNLNSKASEDEEKDKKLNQVLELGEILISTADSVSSAWSNVFASINDGIAKVGDSINKGERGWTKYGKVASAGISVASSMLGTLAEMQDTQTKDGFEKNKKLQIASATMAMLAGIVNTWQSVMSRENSWLTIWGQVAAGASISAMMLATGLSQINQIRNTTFDGSGGGSVASPSITALSAMQSPVETVTQVQGASAEEDIKDTRIYVVEADITSTQKNVRTTQSEATF